ncbi:DUF6682 family protein [Undibacterium sp. Ji42W]|uniref:phage adaptor protein n=1 Tax=Undibacterium sp. Ji42W TaxID=3413039 RepID=UPI003BF3A62D
MGTILASAIINKAATLLLDEGNTRWTRTELLQWLSQAQRVISMRFPNMCNSLTILKLVAGTKQRLPPDGWLLLDVVRNMGTDGLTPGSAIRVVSQELVDSFDPAWHTITKVAAPDNFVYNPKDQTAFYVYPPADGTCYVEVNYAAVPPELTAESSPIYVNDILEPTIVDYICFRAHSKDAEYAAGVQLASLYQNSFAQMTAAKDQAELQNQPNLDLAQFDPTVRGSA